eukprot:TRINITY_DN1831_c0_g1_i7.p1 TRINITY_DN1831_c0_g1~~TRINITY_DN1831_c0_g1_i7.p1  ORF type:complete len:523 (-),score=28.86 TRINITY_DN1831_c0_g1_i7:1015-2583(-)
MLMQVLVIITIHTCYKNTFQLHLSQALQDYRDFIWFMHSILSIEMRLLPIYVVFVLLIVAEMKQEKFFGKVSSGGRFRHLLQDAEELSAKLSTGSCNPSIEDCSVKSNNNLEEEIPLVCTDVVPVGSEVTCEEQAASGFCTILSDEYCMFSCNKCCSNDVPPGVSNCTAVVAAGLCEMDIAKGTYCMESCGVCPHIDPRLSVEFSPSSDLSPSDWDLRIEDLRSPSDTILYEPPPTSSFDDDCSQPGALKCDLDALISFKDTISQGSDLFSSWTGEDPCDWLYVTCEDIDSSHKRVSKIIMNYYRTENENKISGMIVPEFSKLRYVKVILLIYQEDITGTLPVEYNVLDKLTEFQIWGTSISGSFPVEYSSWTQLENFACSYNSMSGTIPMQWSSWDQLQYFHICCNTQLSSTLPVQLSMWVDIIKFDVSSSSFAQSAMHKIEDFSVYENQVVVCLPSTPPCPIYQNLLLIEIPLQERYQSRTAHCKKYKNLRHGKMISADRCRLSIPPWIMWNCLVLAGTI